MATRWGSSSEHDPVTWIHGHPIYAAHFVVLVFVLSMLVTTVFMFTGTDPMLGWLAFRSADVLHGEVWRIFTYGLVNRPSLWFVFDMVMIAWFGRELEKIFGRKSFLRFFGCLYLLSPLLFTALGLWYPTAFAGQTGAFAIFIAFATLYPGAVLFFNLLAWWVAAILVGIFTLMALGARDETGLLSLWSTVGFAFLYVRHAQGRLNWPRLPMRRPRSASSSTPGPRKETTPARIDALLDKIAASGMESLTPREREQLEAARSDMLKRDPRRKGHSP